jgi:hypothetical protein
MCKLNASDFPQSRLPPPRDPGFLEGQVDLRKIGCSLNKLTISITYIYLIYYITEDLIAKKISGILAKSKLKPETEM